MNEEKLFMGCNILKFLEEKTIEIKKLEKENMTKENLEGFDYAVKNILSLIEALIHDAEIDDEILVHTSKLDSTHKIEEFDLHDLLKHFHCRVVMQKEANHEQRNPF